MICYTRSSSGRAASPAWPAAGKDRAPNVSVPGARAATIRAGKEAWSHVQPAVKGATEGAADLRRRVGGDEGSVGPPAGVGGGGGRAARPRAPLEPPHHPH